MKRSLSWSEPWDWERAKRGVRAAGRAMPFRRFAVYGLAIPLAAALAVTALGFEDGTSAGFHSTGNARVRVVAGGHGSDHALELCDRDADWNSIELDLTGFAPAGSPCVFAAYRRRRPFGVRPRATRRRSGPIRRRTSPGGG